MATIQPTKVQLPPGDGSVVMFQWTLTGTDTGAPIDFAQWADRSVQFTGNFGAGTVAWEGSNDGGTTYAQLTDPQGNAIAKTAASIEQVSEITGLARPNVTVGVTSVVVSALLRRAG